MLLVNNNPSAVESDVMSVDTMLVAVGTEDKDRIETVGRTVVDVAEPTGATVVIAHILDEASYQRAVEQLDEDRSTGEDEPPDWDGAWSQFEEEATGEDGSPRAVHLETVLHRRQLIRDLAAMLDETAVEYEIRGAVGDPAERVVSMADDLEPDFVVVGGRDRTAAKQALFGSVSEEIIRSVACPVITVRSAERA